MENKIVPLKIRIAALWGIMDSMVFLAIFGLVVFSVAREFISGSFCPHGAPPCNLLNEIAFYGALSFLLILISGLFFLFSKNLFRLKKSGWFGLVCLMILVNVLSFVSSALYHPVLPVAYLFLAMALIPLVLLLLGRKSFFKLSS